MPVRVCHIAATTDGATWMLEQLRDLRDRKGYEVSAIISAGSGKLAGRLESAGIPFKTFDFEFPSGKDWRSLLDRVVALARLLRHERYDVVQTHLFASMVLTRLAAWLADVPVRLAMIAGPYHLEADTPRWIDGGTCWMETGLIASCEHTRRLYLGLGVPEHRVSVIYYGPDATKFDRDCVRPADLRAELGLPEAAKLVGMIAYFYPRLPVSRWTPRFLHDRANKRQEDLIDAVPAVLSEFPEARFLFVGSGWGEAGEKELELAKQRAADLELGDSVIFTGYRSDVNEVLAALDVAVQASLSENLGGTIESLLMECPTVATRTGGLVDTVRDGETGTLVAPNDPADLARGVSAMLRDPAEAKRMARNGRKLMQEQFTLQRTVEDLDALYRRQGAGRRKGYRMTRSALRAAMAGPVFAYLATRLLIDTKYLPRWDLGWRPLPLRQARAAQAKSRRVLVHLAQARARAALRMKVAMRSCADDRPTGPADVVRVLCDMVRRVARALTVVVGKLLRRATLCSAWLAGLPRPIGRWCGDQLTRLGAWSRLQPLYAYGFVRYLLRDSDLLKKWDVFFSWIRGRERPL